MTNAATYGQRFLETWKRHAGVLGDFAYGEIQEMKAADCEELVRVLRTRNPHLSYATIQLLRESEPEEAARVLFSQAQAAAQTSLFLFLALV